MAEKLIVAGTLEEALLAKSSDSVFLAGGTEINRLQGSVDAKELISIHRIKELKGICEKAGRIWIGACSTFQEAVDSPLVPAYFKEACMMMASRTKRNMATIGGNVALLRDDSYIVPALLASGAVVAYMDGKKEVMETCISSFVTDRQAGKLGDVLILGIGLDPERRVFNYRSANTAMSYSRLNVSLGCDAKGEDITIAAAVKNCGLFRLVKLEEAVNADPAITEEAIIEWVKNCKACVIPSDMYGSEEYKRYLLGASIAKMVADARKEA